MRKYLIAISTYAFATVLLADVNDINNLKNANVNIADAARMSLEKSLDQDTSERALYENLLTQKDLRLANGIIYSLGKMKSSIAKAIIMEFAKTSSDKYPASIFALAEYNDRDSITILEKLSKSNQNARAALDMTKKASLSANSPKLVDYSNVDENSKISILHNITADNKTLESILKIEPISEREAIGLCFALAKFGKDSCVNRIIEISKKYPNAQNISIALSRSDNTDKAIIKSASEGNIVALKAISLRRISEAEDSVLKLIAKTSDSNIRKVAFDALRNIGGIPAFKMCYDNIKNQKAKDLLDSVKVCAFAYKRLTSDDLKLANTMLDSMLNNGDKRQISAVEKIRPNKQ